MPDAEDPDATHLFDSPFAKEAVPNTEAIDDDEDVSDDEAGAFASSADQTAEFSVSIGAGSSALPIDADLPQATPSAIPARTAPPPTETGPPLTTSSSRRITVQGDARDHSRSGRVPTSRRELQVTPGTGVRTLQRIAVPQPPSAPPMATQPRITQIPVGAGDDEDMSGLATEEGFHHDDDDDDVDLPTEEFGGATAPPPASPPPALADAPSQLTPTHADPRPPSAVLADLPDAATSGAPPSDEADDVDPFDEPTGDFDPLDLPQRSGGVSVSAGGGVSHLSGPAASSVSNEAVAEFDDNDDDDDQDVTLERPIPMVKATSGAVSLDGDVPSAVDAPVSEETAYESSVVDDSLVAQPSEPDDSVVADDSFVSDDASSVGASVVDDSVVDASSEGPLASAVDDGDDFPSAFAASLPAPSAGQRPATLKDAILAPPPELSSEMAPKLADAPASPPPEPSVVDAPAASAPTPPPPPNEELLADYDEAEDEVLGRLVVDAPVDAVVFLDGRDVGTGQVDLKDLDRFTTYVVRVHRAGCHPWTAEVSLGGREAARVSPDLRPK